METHIFKTVDCNEIVADIYPTTGRENPAVLFIHGGGLIMGSRKAILPSQIETFNASGFHFVSINYRLAPETKLPGIISDIEDAWTWLQQEAFSLGIDRNRIAVLGHSAGAYLALICGYKLDPRPVAIVSLAGYGDLTSEAFTTPSPHHVTTHESVVERNARLTVGELTTSESGPNDSMQYYLGRGLYYLFCRQQGIWLREVSGHDPSDKDWFEEYEPIRNVSGEYPPTMLLHGEPDSEVLIGHSELLQQEFVRHGVQNEFIRHPEWGHAFLYMPNDESVGDAFNQIVAFLMKYV
jgi:acetyl esterase/lipase